MKEPLPPVEQLLGDVASTQYRVRARAARALGECGDLRAVEPLIRALGDRTVPVRQKAATALGRLRDPRAIGPLFAALHDINGDVRHAAASALKKFGKAAYAPALEAYKSDNPTIRFVALGVLGRSRSAATSELLIAALDDPDLRVRMEATRLLAQRKERKAVERLIAAIDDPDLRVRMEAARLLAQRKEQGAAERLIAALDRPDPCLWLYVQALGEIGDPRAFEPLQALLDSRDFHVQSAAVKALRKIDNARAVDLLYERLEDPTRDDRHQFARDLAGMDLMDAVQSLSKTAHGGKLDILAQAQERLLSAQNQMRAYAQALSSGDASLDRSEIHQARVEAMRQLESELRDLIRKPKDA